MNITIPILNPRKKWTVEEIDRANEAAGHKWFQSHVLYHKRRIGKEVFQGKGGIYFIASCILEGIPTFSYAQRIYNVHRFIPENAGIHLVKSENTRHEAMKAARHLAKKEVMRMNQSYDKAILKIIDGLREYSEAHLYNTNNLLGNESQSNIQSDIPRYWFTILDRVRGLVGEGEVNEINRQEIDNLLLALARTSGFDPIEYFLHSNDTIRSENSNEMFTS